ncbi:rcc01693 family protein [Roseicyclus persicicus]|uniref:Phage tail assembly chaperone n=1 Tax=Roseicyclus persicicus TaxID=2650661 RepID=A0A7X6H1H1_9RHOB|nr:rcc01693 family protein [Roseibacterium persicicum]NKX46307.1 phage tail assembly chaperone [Roseibacterium persicicum]
MSAPRFDWPALMRAGLQGLGLTPDAFWRLTPAELLLMLGEVPGAAPMGRGALEALIARFPDRTDKEGGDGRDG